MQHSITLPSLGLVAAFLAGLSFACRSEETPNSDHCHHVAGDQTCAELFGSERPFCSGPGETCTDDSDNHGCVAELPPQECYSPCGDGAFADEDSSCLESAEEGESAGEDDTGEAEGDGDSDSDGDRDGDGDGDRDGDPDPICGDGVVDDDEQCDDGNGIDDDECSNSCVMATCGDGIVQAVLGETCDDGNTISGDACASTCVLPGTVIWEKVLEDSCSSPKVALSTTGHVYVGCKYPDRVVRFDETGEKLWETNVGLQPFGGNKWLVAGLDDGFAVGGQMGAQGQTRYFDGDGNYVWSRNIPAASTWVLGVAVDGGGNVISVGGNNPGQDGFIYRYGPNGNPAVEVYNASGGRFLRVAVSSAGRAWVLRGNSVLSFSDDNQLLWERQPLPGDEFREIAVDHEDNVFVTGPRTTGGSFVVYRFDTTGVGGWSAHHVTEGVDEWSYSIAVLPNGNALIVGYTNGMDVNNEWVTDGLLSWYAADGENFVDVVLDGEGDIDYDAFTDVAVSSEGYAVAVGRTGTANQSNLWLVKFAI